MELGTFYGSIDGYKYGLDLVRSWGKLFCKRLENGIRILFGSKLGNDDVLILGSYGGASYDKRPEVDIVI